MTRNLRIPSAARGCALLLMALLFCACSTARAAGGADARTAAAAGNAPATKAGKGIAAAAEGASDDEEADVHASHLSDSELGRAVALIDKDPKRAAASLEALQKKMPWIADVLAYHEAVARGRFDREAGRRELERFLADEADSILFADATLALAHLVEADGDVDEAVALADRYGRGGGDTGQAAGVCLAAGRLLVTKDAGRAWLYLQCARQKSPMSASARRADELIAKLRAAHPELRPSTAPEMLAEARLLGKENRGPEQAALLRQILEKYPSSADGEAELMFGRVLGKQESKLAGAQFFEQRATSASGARKAKLLYESATLYWNDDRNDQAEALFGQMLALDSRIGDEQQAMYALARIADAENRRADAIRWFGRAAAAAKGSVRADSQWRQAWVSYKAKDFETAEKAFRTMAENAPHGSDTDGRPEALYWQGRSLERLGRNDDARVCYEAVLEEFPLGYYAAVAEKRLGRRTVPTSVVRTPAVPASLPPPAALALRRSATLREAGLVTLASRDLSSRLARFDAPTRRAVLPALPASGAYDAAFRIAVEMTDKGELSREEARAYFYPRAFDSIVQREAKATGLDPVLVFALMRQESAFNTTAVSSAKALGLMQMLEKTARRVAAASKLPEPQPDDLFEPAVNIRLGTRYLAELSKQFGGNTALMAAAYNAGETAAARWQDLTTRWDEDEMIEQISYRETRSYVKSVLRNMRNYRSIYGSDLGGTAAHAD